MTYTFKLSRRLARLKCASVVGLSLGISSCTAGGDALAPPPTDPLILIAPDSTAVAVNQTVQFEAVGAVAGVSLSARRSRVVTLQVTPVSSKLPPGGLQPYTATAIHSYGSTGLPSVTWSATGGTVDASGKYTAGNVTGKYQVIARTWNGAADTAVVTIVTLARVMVTPASVGLLTGATQQLTATAVMSDSSTAAIPVTWSATGGTISSTGLYTAGPTGAATARSLPNPGETSRTPPRSPLPPPARLHQPRPHRLRPACPSCPAKASRRR